MRVAKIHTTFGEEIEFGSFTVLVGANNVGKSQTLRDIHNRVVQGHGARTVLVDQVVVEKPGSFEDLFRGLQTAQHPTQVGTTVVRGITANLTSGEEVGINFDSFRQQFDSARDAAPFLSSFGRFRVAYLDASSRLSVAAATQSYNPHTQPPTRLLHGLFASGEPMESKLRDAFRDTFRMDVRLDYSGMVQLALRVAKEFAPIPADPRQAYPVMRQYAELDSQGDGFRSFVGVVLSLLLSEGRIVLLDEPEAFLHPAQARRLGYWVAQYASAGSNQVIVATHNAHFLAGILNSGVAVDIFRVNRKDDTTTYHKIPSESILQLARSPLLSSQSVLDAVFHRGVVVCEADSDRAVYQTVAAQVGNQNVLFLHAQSKQTVKDVAGLLTKASIPVCAIVDLDIINSAPELEALLNALALAADHMPLLNRRSDIAAAVEGRSDDAILDDVKTQVADFLRELDEKRHSLSGVRSALRRMDTTASRWAPIKRGGIAVLANAERAKAEELLQLAKKDGLWIVPVGELESWIDLGTRQKKRWIVTALKALHESARPDRLGAFVQEILVYLGELPDASLGAAGGAPGQ